ncbi:MAG: glycosyl transferase, partial [Alloprevotella sp.]|nr:glycosyl transferase [Alloprevotella sp.]
MKRDKNSLPDWVFEVSWEVCNKVGGIYTVLSSHARVLQDALDNRLVFIGPDLGENISNRDFREDRNAVDVKWIKAAD